MGGRGEEAEEYRKVNRKLRMWERAKNFLSRNSREPLKNSALILRRLWEIVRRKKVEFASGRGAGARRQPKKKLRR
jgi:hypothetical protein